MPPITRTRFPANEPAEATTVKAGATTRRGVRAMEGCSGLTKKELVALVAEISGELTTSFYGPHYTVERNPQIKIFILFVNSIQI